MEGVSTVSTWLLSISTSLRPSPPTRTLVRELSQILPNTKRVTRGGKSFRNLCNSVYATGCNRLLLISSSKGNPSSIELYEIKPDVYEQVPSCCAMIEGYTLVRDSVFPKTRRIAKISKIILSKSVDSEHEQLIRAFFSFLNLEISYTSIDEYHDVTNQPLIHVEQNEPTLVTFTLTTSLMLNEREISKPVLPKLKIRGVSGERIF